MGSKRSREGGRQTDRKAGRQTDVCTYRRADVLTFHRCCVFSAAAAASEGRRARAHWQGRIQGGLCSPAQGPYASNSCASRGSVGTYRDSHTVTRTQTHRHRHTDTDTHTQTQTHTHTHRHTQRSCLITTLDTSLVVLVPALVVRADFPAVSTRIHWRAACQEDAHLGIRAFFFH